VNPYKCSSCGGELGHESGCPLQPAVIDLAAKLRKAFPNVCTSDGLDRCIRCPRNTFKECVADMEKEKLMQC
jgi:hypothetical protein